MNNKRFDTYCGLYCGACEVMNAETYQDKVRVTEMWKGIIDVSPEQVHCSGCKNDDLFFNCEQCTMRPCAISKGVEFCIDCNEFPCTYYHEGKQMVEQVPSLRHMKAIIKNLRDIREHGIKEWLDIQKTNWECPECKATFSWYTQECQQCGSNLIGIKDYETLSEEDSSF